MAHNQQRRGSATGSVRAGNGNQESKLDVHRSGSAWSITHMPPDIAKYAIDTPVDYDVKAADMKRHQDDDNKDGFQRALLCLQSAELNQKVFAAQTLFPLLLQDENRVFKEVIPAIETELKKNFDPEFQGAVADSMTKAVSQLLSKSQQRARQLIAMGASLAASSSDDISDAWHRCFDVLMDLLSSADLQREIIPHIVDRLGKENATSNAKRVAAKLLNKLAKKLPEEAISKRLFPTVESLCKDKEAIVRGTMCVRLPEIIAKLKNKDRVHPLLNNLLGDTDPHVMSTLVGALGKTITLMNLKDPKSNAFFLTAIPIFKKLVKKAYVDGNSGLLIEFSAHMGQLTSVLSTSGVLTGGDKLWFLDAYLQLSRYGLPNAFHAQGKGTETMPTGFVNFRANKEFSQNQPLIDSLISTGASKGAEAPGMSTAATLELLKGNNNNLNNSSNNKTPTGGRGSRRSIDSNNDNGWLCRANAAGGFFHFLKFAKPLVEFKHGLHPMVVDLMHDPIPAVRANMAENINPIMQFLGTDGALLHGEVVCALSDDNISVIEAIVPNLAEILKCFVKAKLISPDAMTNATVEIGGAILFCEERLSQTNDWRGHATMLEQLSVLPFCLPGDHVYNNFVPALFHRLLHMRQLPCRIAAADAIVSFLRHCRRSHQRDDIRRRIKEGFAQGRSVHDRMLFLFMSKKIMELFSRKYYRDHFFESTLAMADDNVPNIRLKAVNMMPEMKNVLQMSKDPALLQKLEETLVKIKNSENDKDVQNAIESVIPVMAKVGVVLKKDRKGPKTKEDLEDESKEREEDFIASLEPPANAKIANKPVSKPEAPKPAPPPPPPAAPAPPNLNYTKLPLQNKAPATNTGEPQTNLPPGWKLVRKSDDENKQKKSLVPGYPAKGTKR